MESIGLESACIFGRTSVSGFMPAVKQSNKCYLFFHFFLFLQNISAYMGTRLSGKVMATFVRGNLVYTEGKHAPAACGVPILAKR